MSKVDVLLAGTLLSVVGKKRYMSKHSRMLIHQLRGGFWGKMEDLEECMEDCREAMEDIIEIYIQHTTMKRGDIKTQLKKDRWWDYNTSKQKGLIDEEWKNNY